MTSDGGGALGDRLEIKQEGPLRATTMTGTMNIVVCVKYVPDATADRHFESDKTVDREGVDGLLSELDEYAVEQALQIKERSETPDDTHVIALCVGPEKGVDAVRKALQMGVDSGVHVTDEAIAGSDAVATSLVLAKAVEKIGAGLDSGKVDLVMCGMASTDGVMSVVPAMLAERLDLPQVTFASVVETQGDQVRIKRDGDVATDVVGATMPLVISVTDQSGEARYPSFKGIMAAKKKPLETYSLGDLGVDPGDVGLSAAWTEVTETTERPPRTAGEIVTDEDGSGAAALTDFLAAKKFI
ncbi:electron transfer flavoprotein subunit beta/FixA family protein [Nocardioides sp.]|uniref:electron transfer flavoprotein subunit beta/FixA family protein n=1 Tax=Nocardioides sp. TaxID=35761 RepID=UPI002ED54AD2